MRTTCENCRTVHDGVGDDPALWVCPYCEHVNRPPEGAAALQPDSEIEIIAEHDLLKTMVLPMDSQPGDTGAAVDPVAARMVEDMRIRGFARTTQYNYIRAINQFAQHFGSSPERLSAEDARTFLVYLITEASVSCGMLQHYVSALRFLYRVTLHQPWAIEKIPYPRREFRLPDVPSRETSCAFSLTCPTSSTVRSS